MNIIVHFNDGKTENFPYTTYHPNFGGQLVINRGDESAVHISLEQIRYWVVDKTTEKPSSASCPPHEADAGAPSGKRGPRDHQR